MEHKSTWIRGWERSKALENKLKASNSYLRKKQSQQEETYNISTNKH